MSVMPAGAERHVYANSSDRIVNAPITSKVWVELQPGERVTYWSLVGNGVSRRRRTRRQIIGVVSLIVFVVIVLSCAFGLASLYVQSQLG